MVNNVVLIGRLTKDPEIRMTQSGTKVCQYTLAVNRRQKAQDQPDADFISCVAWNKTAEIMEQWLRKGSLIGVEGRIQTRSYDDKQGRRVYVTEVVTHNIDFLEPKGSAAAPNSYGQANTYQAQYRGSVSPKQSYYDQPSQNYSEYGDTRDTLDIASDDLPF